MHRDLGLLGRWRRIAAVPVLLALGAAALGGCAGTASSPPPAMSSVAITDFRAVAGRWAGPVIGLAMHRTEGDWIQLAIAEDGTYDFGIVWTIGVFGGKGKFTLKDGKLLMEGERGRATYALYEGDGRRYLRADGVLGSGGTVSAELKPAR